MRRQQPNREATSRETPRQGRAQPGPTPAGNVRHFSFTVFLQRYRDRSGPSTSRCLHAFGKEPTRRKKNQCIRVAVRRAANHVIASLFDLPTAPAGVAHSIAARQGTRDPLSRTQAARATPPDRNPKADNILIEGRVVVEFTILTQNRGAALIEYPRENDVTAESAARTARRTLPQIGSGGDRCSGHFLFSLGMLCSHGWAEDKPKLAAPAKSAKTDLAIEARVARTVGAAL